MSTCAVSATVDEMTAEEGYAMVDALSKDRLGIAADEFLRRLDAGEYDTADTEDIIRLRMMAPFAR